MPPTEALLLAQPAGPVARPSARVWKLRFAGDLTLALKLAAPNAPLDAEQRTLAWLAGQGAPVPAVLATDPAQPSTWMALEWCGDDTLDDALQRTDVLPPDVRRAAEVPEARAAGRDEVTRLGGALAAAVAAVERAFAPATARLRADPASWLPRCRALQAQTEPWAAGAVQGLTWLTGAPPSQSLAEALNVAVALAMNTPPSAGSLDYNARNAVLNSVAGETPRLTLLDFSATGVDWPARRFVQYGTATGSGRRSGNFVSAIQRESTLAYAEAVAPTWGTDAPAVQQTVDAHDLLLLLTAAQTLRAIATGKAHPERARAWTGIGTDLSARRARLLSLLRRPLAPDGPAESVRARLRDATD